MSKTTTTTQTNDQTPQKVFVAEPYDRAYVVDKYELLHVSAIREFNAHSLPLLKKFGLFKSTDLQTYTSYSVQDCINAIIRREVTEQGITDPIDVQNYIVARTPVLKSELTEYSPMMSSGAKYFECTSYNHKHGDFEYDSKKAERVFGIWAEDEKSLRVLARLQEVCELLNSFAVSPDVKLSDIIAGPDTDLTSVYKVRSVMRRGQWKEFIKLQPDGE